MIGGWPNESFCDNELVFKGNEPFLIVCDTGMKIRFISNHGVIATKCSQNMGCTKEYQGKDDDADNEERFFAFHN